MSLPVFFSRLWFGVVLLSALPLLAAPARPEPEMRWLENDLIRVGVDLHLGGSITSLVEKADGRELINNYDLGRQVQMSFYGGPIPFSPDGHEPHPHWRGLGWNPIQTGDWAGTPARVVEHRNTLEELYTKVIPMQWPLRGVAGDCEFESWIRLEGRSVVLRCRLKNRREDAHFYPARHQELPAVYANGAFSKVVTYSGEHPFGGGALSEWIEPGPPWRAFFATEHWAALVDRADRGIGVWQKDTTYWKGGEVPGEQAQQTSRDMATGYLSPIALEHLDPHITYEYETRLVAGTVPQIRALVGEWEKERCLPQYQFEVSRKGWSVRGGVDAGVPFSGRWKVQVQQGTVFLEGPAIFWRAEQAGHLRLKAAVHSQSGRLRVAWKPLHPETGEGSVVCALKPDGELRESVFLLQGQAGYEGGLVRLMLRFEGLQPGDMLEIEAIGLEQ